MGVLIEIRAKKWFSISAGATYDVEGYQTKHPIDILYYTSSTSPGQPYNNDTTFNAARISYEYQYVSIPILFNYTFYKKNIDFSFGIGAELKYLTNYYFGDRNFSDPESLQRKTLPQRTSLFSSANINVSFPLGKKIWLFTEPFYKYQLSDNMDGRKNNNGINLWALDCRVGLKF